MTNLVNAEKQMRRKRLRVRFLPHAAAQREHEEIIQLARGKKGAEAIYDLLCKLDLDKLSYQLREKANDEKTTMQRKTEALKRLQIVESFRSSRDVNRPEWMILKVVPVTPPELRPLVPLSVIIRLLHT